MNSYSNPGRRSRGAVTALVAVVVFVAAGLATAADRPVNESGRMPADGRVTVSNIAGMVKVIGWDKAEISVTGTLGDDVERLEFSAGERAEVEVIYKDQRKGLRDLMGNRKGEHHDSVSINDGADLTIQVPRGCRLEVEVVAAGVDVSGLDAVIEVTSVSGDVDVRGACRRLEIDSVSGRVEVDGAGAESEVSTVSGSLRIRCDDSDLQVDTVTGDASVDCASLRSLQTNTVNGTISMSGRPASGATIEAESVNGSLTLAVPGDVSAAFEVTTFNGDIENAFGQKPERTDQYVPGQELTFTNGSGAADIKLNTLNGKIRILRK